MNHRRLAAAFNIGLMANRWGAHSGNENKSPVKNCC